MRSSVAPNIVRAIACTQRRLKYSLVICALEAKSTNRLEGAASNYIRCEQLGTYESDSCKGNILDL